MRLAAAAELSYQGSFVNQHLKSLFPDRSVDSIKGLRKSTLYLSIKNDLALALPAHTVEELIPPVDVLFSPDELPLPDLPPNPTVKLSSRLEYVSTLLPTICSPQISSLVGTFLSNSPPHLTRQALDDAVTSLSSSLPKRRPKCPRPVADTSKYRRRIKIQRFARHQRLWRLNRRMLCKIIEEGDAPSVFPSTEEIDATYRTLYESPSPPDDSPFTVSGPTVDIMFPITSEELQQHLRGLSASSSPGPDRLTVSDVRALPLPDLAALLNCVLQFGDVPLSWKIHRTTLIPKSTVDLHLATNWRPITIASVLSRLLNRILAARLQHSITLSPRQKAFIPADGCLTNTLILDAAIREARRCKTELNMVALDVSKAFDSVSRHSLTRALRRFNLSPEFIGFLAHSYESCTTSIRAGETECKNVSMTRGVKQGDPLSPMLFNMVLDELLTSLPPTIGLPIGDQLVNCLGFADDVVLLASSKTGMEVLLQQSSAFFSSRSLKLNAQKSFVLRLVPSVRNRVVTVDRKCKFILAGSPLKAIDHANPFKYLGINFDPSGKLALNLDSLSTLLAKLKRAPLKPQQKLSLLRTHILPRFSYRLMLGRLTIGLLERFDVLVRQFVKALLHLPHDIADAAFHTTLKEGGLGIPSMLTLVPASLYKRLGKLDRSPDPVVSAVMKVSCVVNVRLKCLSILNRFGPSAITRPAVYWRNRWYGTTDGRALADFACNTAGQSWLLGESPFPAGREFCDLVKLRVGRLDTRVTSSRGRPNNKRCRHCNLADETLNHVTQKCTATHGLRVRRHDAVLKKLATLLAERKELSVSKEPRIVAAGQLYKPDLIVVAPGNIYVVDVIITGDSPDGLQRAADFKVEKYHIPALEAQLRAIYGQHPVTHLPFVVSSRGCFWAKNDKVLQLAGAKSRRLDFVLLSMRWTLRIWRFFCLL